MPQFLRHAIYSNKAFWNNTKKAFIDAMSLFYCLFQDKQNIKRVTIKNIPIIASIKAFLHGQKLGHVVQTEALRYGMNITTILQTGRRIWRPCDTTLFLTITAYL